MKHGFNLTFAWLDSILALRFKADLSSEAIDYPSARVVVVPPLLLINGLIRAKAGSMMF